MVPRSQHFVCALAHTAFNLFS